MVETDIQLQNTCKMLDNDYYMHKIKNKTYKITIATSEN